MFALIYTVMYVLTIYVFACVNVFAFVFSDPSRDPNVYSNDKRVFVVVIDVVFVVIVVSVYAETGQIIGLSICNLDI